MHIWLGLHRTGTATVTSCRLGTSSRAAEWLGCETSERGVSGSNPALIVVCQCHVQPSCLVWVGTLVACYSGLVHKRKGVEELVMLTSTLVA